MDTIDRERLLRLNPTASANAEFWNELCGTTLARQEGIAGRSPDDLTRFDAAYLSFYPYLSEYLPSATFSGRAVLEIGLGYGTLGQRLSETARLYCGVDIAMSPLAMMAARLASIGVPARVSRATARQLPFIDESFDCVVSIGCLHHTGSLQESVSEVHRVLKAEGLAIIMLYNQFSYRQWMRFPLRTTIAAIREALSGPREHPTSLAQRRLYDADSRGVAAPQTVLVSRRGIRRLFQHFSEVTIRTENCDDVIPGGGRLRARQRLLRPLGRTLGLDLYLVARK